MASDNGMILVMGETGVGKSTFINALKPNAVEVGHTLKSGKSEAASINIRTIESLTVVSAIAPSGSSNPSG